MGRLSNLFLEILGSTLGSRISCGSIWGPFGDICGVSLAPFWVPGGSGGRSGSHLGPNSAQGLKNIVKVTWWTPPKGPSWEPTSELEAF